MRRSSRASKVRPTLQVGARSRRTLRRAPGSGYARAGARDSPRHRARETCAHARGRTTAAFSRRHGVADRRPARRHRGMAAGGDLDTAPRPLGRTVAADSVSVSARRSASCVHERRRRGRRAGRRRRHRAVSAAARGRMDVTVTQLSDDGTELVTQPATGCGRGACRPCACRRAAASPTGCRLPSRSIAAVISWPSVWRIGSCSSCWRGGGELEHVAGVLRSSRSDHGRGVERGRISRRPVAATASCASGTSHPARRRSRSCSRPMAPYSRRLERRRPFCRERRRARRARRRRGRWPRAGRVARRRRRDRAGLCARWSVACGRTTTGTVVLAPFATGASARACGSMPRDVAGLCSGRQPTRRRRCERHGHVDRHRWQLARQRSALVATDSLARFQPRRQRFVGGDGRVAARARGDDASPRAGREQARGVACCGHRASSDLGTSIRFAGVAVDGSLRSGVLDLTAAPVGADDTAALVARDWPSVRAAT